MEEAQRLAGGVLVVTLGAVIGALGALLVRDLRRGGWGGRRGRGDHLPEALALYLLVMVTYVPVGALLHGWSVELGLSVAQLGLLFLPALVAPRIWGLPTQETLSLRGVPARALGGAAILGLSTWLPIGMFMTLQEQVLPLPPGYEEAFADMVIPSSPAEWVGAVAAFAVVPAVCEELLFRGALLGLARGALGDRRAIGLTALLFGLLHLEPYRILPTLILGLLLGLVVVWTGSLWPSMVLHLAHNGALLTLGMIYRGNVEEDPPAALVAAGLLGLAVGGVALFGVTRSRTGPDPSATARPDP